MAARDFGFELESPSPDGDWEAYVGLREKGKAITLRVPHGYPKDVDVSEKSGILGELMRVVARFSAAFPNEKRSEFEGQSTRDGFIFGNGGQSLRFSDEGADVSYSNLSRYLELIRHLRDPRLLALVKAPGLTSQFDHRHIARNIERATFLPDGTPVFDQLWAPRAQMRRTSNDMVGLACWMALDGLRRLFPDPADSAGDEISTALRAEWEALSSRFADECGLEADASLFSARRADTLSILQSALEICMRRAPPVSSDARELHRLLDDLIHHALSEQSGDIWGLRGFHHVWESACLEYAIAQGELLGEIFTCDYQYLHEIDPKIRAKWRKNRADIFCKHGIERRPDLVVKKHDGSYLIVDFKYYAESESETFVKERPRQSNLELDAVKRGANDFCWREKKYRDVANIEAYRWLLMEHGPQPVSGSSVKLEFWVPGCSGGRVECSWMSTLSLVGKPAREVLGAYARKFRLMD